MLMWGLIRDDELYEAHRTLYRAEMSLESYEPGSKHKWRVTRIMVMGWDEDTAKKQEKRKP